MTLYRGGAAEVYSPVQSSEVQTQFYRLQSHTAALNFVPPGTRFQGERQL